jgi:dynein heavy chain
MDLIDSVSNVTDKPADGGVYVHGLYLEGCGWNREKHALEDSQPKQLFSCLPIIHFMPVIDKTNTPRIYRCPAYKVVSRRGVLSTTGHSTNFVLFVELQTNEQPSKWILAGVAIFLSLKY